MRTLRSIFVGLVVSCVLVAGCGGSSSPHASAAKLTKVTVMLDWTPNTNHSGIYLAQHEGWYKSLGLDVKILQPGQNSDVEQIVGNNTVDFGISASEQLIPARTQGIPIVSIAAILQHNTSSLISLKSAGISRPRDLTGKTYGAFGGTFEKALIDKLVSCDGGNPSKVRFTQVGDADYRNGLTRHQYDAVWVFDGWDVLKISHIDKLPINRIPFINYPTCVPDWYTPILITNEKLIKTQPGLVRRFMSATARGYRTAMTDPSQASSALLAGAPELDPILVRDSAHYLASRYATDPKAWGRQDPAVWSRFVGFLAASKIIKPGFATDDAFTNAFLPRSTP